LLWCRGCTTAPPRCPLLLSVYGASSSTITVIAYISNTKNENSYAMHITGGYCWRTQKCRNLCVRHAFFEGKKAGETSPRKSTARTLKEVRQQYPGVYRPGWGIHLKRDTVCPQLLSAMIGRRFRGRGKSSMFAKTVSKRSGNPRRKNRAAGVVPSAARQSKLCSTVHTL
jgi:hypothetical protein